MTRRGQLFYLILILVSIVLDRLVKWVTVTSMEVGDTKPLVGDIFSITYVKNSGAAFSLFSEHTWILTVVTIALIVVCVAVLIIKRNIGLRPATVGLSLLIGGGIGNLIDRVAFGFVTDMFDLKNFAVFNVADIFVCVGVVLIIVDLLFGKKIA